MDRAQESPKEGPKHAPGMIPAWLVVSIGFLLNLFFILQSFLGWLTATNDRGDSWEPMRLAYEWYMHPHQGTIYQYFFLQAHIKFQYPPSALLLFAAADWLHLDLTNANLNLIGWLLVGIQAIALAIIGYTMSQKQKGATRNPFHRWFGLLLIAALNVVFYPVIRSYLLGQVQTWLNAWFVIACLCWLCGRRLAAGLFIGAICLFKPQLSLFFIWAALRGQGRFLLGWAAIVVPGEVLALIVFGFPNHLDYLTALQFMAHHGEFMYTNQSVNGILNRYLGNSSVGNIYPSYVPLVYRCTLLSSAVLVITTLFYRMRSEAINVIDLLIAGLSFTLASPIAWDHHFGILPPCIVVLMTMIGSMAPTGKKQFLALALAVMYTLSAYPLHPDLFPAKGMGSILESTLFFGAVGILCLLYFLRDQASRLQGKVLFHTGSQPGEGVF